MQSAARTFRFCKPCFPNQNAAAATMLYCNQNVVTRTASALAKKSSPESKNRNDDDYQNNNREFNIWERIDRAKSQARSLLELPKLTVPSDFTKAKRALDTMKNNTQTVDTETVGLALSLLWKVVEDAALTKNAAATAWSCEPRFFNSIFHLWKKASRQQKPMVSPAAFLQKLQQLVRKNPAFRYNITTFAILMNVIVYNEPPERAPVVVQGLLELIRQEAEHTKIIDLNPNDIIYTQCCFAWANSGLPEAKEQLNKLLRQMRREGIKLNEVCSSILLKFWAGEGDVVEVEGILESMREDSVPLEIHSLSHCFNAYIQAGDTVRAEEFFNDMMRFQSQNILEDNVQRQCVIDILSTCRKKIMEQPTRQKELLEQAERIFERANREKPSLLDGKERNRILFLLMEIFVKADELPKAERMVEEVESLLHKSLSDERAQLNLNMFNVLLLVYSRITAKKPDAVNKAFEVFRLLREHPKCKKQQLCPDVNSFHSLLSCLWESNDNHYGQHARDLLDEMERMHLDGDSQMKPSEIIYVLTIKTILKSGNSNMAEELFERIVESGIATDIGSVNDVLNSWNSFRPGRRCVRVALKTLRAIQNAPGETSSLKPDASTYNIVMHAMLVSCSKLTNDGYHDWMDEMWNLYQEMREMSFLLKKSRSAQLVDYICSKAHLGNKELMDRAASLVKDMEESDDDSAKPDHRHYLSIVKGWLKVGDLSKATSALLQSVLITSLDQAKPNHSVIALVADRWIESGDLEQASLFLEKMQAFHDNKLLPQGPSDETYKRLFNAWEQSVHPEKEKYVTKLSHRLTGHKKEDSTEQTYTVETIEENIAGLMGSN